MNASGAKTIANIGTEILIIIIVSNESIAVRKKENSERGIVESKLSKSY